MAIVADKAGVGTLDVPWHTHNRVVAADPNGVTTPAFVGEIVLDTATKKRWRAKTAVNNSWVTVDPL